MRRLSVITPFFNEAGNAAHFAGLLAGLRCEVERRFGLGLETVLVDDGSTDGGAEAFALALEGTWKIVRLSRNFGKEIAVFAGLEHADGDFVMIMDADLQHSAETALLLIGELLAQPDIDVVHAVRRDGRTGWRRTQAAGLFYRLINLGQRFDVTPNAGDFRVMRGQVARALAQLRDRKRFNKGLYAWAGFQQRAVPYAPVARGAGDSKWSRLGLLTLSLEAFTSFSVVPLRIMSAIGLVLALCGVFYGVKILLEVWLAGISVPGFASLIVAVVVLGGFNLALLGLVGEYVWVAVSEAKDRPVYLVRDVVASPPAARPGLRRRSKDG